MQIVLAEATGAYPYLPLQLDTSRRLRVSAYLARGGGYLTAQNLTLPAGTSYLNLGLIYPQQTAYVKSLVCKYVGTVTNVILTGCILYGSVYYYITPSVTVVSGRCVGWQLDVPVSANDYLRVEVQGATAGNALYAWATFTG